MSEPANSPPPADGDTAPAAGVEDLRLYVPDHLAWSVHVLTGAEKQYCHQHAPGDAHFHLIVPGEIFVEGGDERLCLNCALRRNVVTVNRLFWQRRES